MTFSPFLKSVTITNFRSIRGEVTVQLDAPVVLIYGQNGAGKTSILSAMELGLTGRIPSFELSDPDYISHLLHKEAEEGYVSVTVDGVDGVSTSSDYTVTRSNILGNPLFSENEAHFYSERCYLGQSTLSRLLEIYENTGVSLSDSPLTRFVKDLLGLNPLDALIEGLFVAGDVRRLREPIPSYGKLRETRRNLYNSIESKETARKGIDVEINTINDRLRTRLGELGVQGISIDADSDLISILENHPEDQELSRLASLRLEIVVVLQELQTIQASVDQNYLHKVKTTTANTQTAVAAWRKSTGLKLETLLADLSEFISDLASPNSVGPQNALSTTLSAIGTELKRCSSVLEHNTEYMATIPVLDQSIAQAQERASVLDSQSAQHKAEAGALAELLAGILQHIHSNDCPVCERDFSEFSKEPLDSHVSNRIKTLTKDAEQLQALVRDRTTILASLAESGRRRKGVAARQMPTAARKNLKDRYSRLLEIKRALTDMGPGVETGEQLISAAATASARLNELRSHDHRIAAIRETANRITQELNLVQGDKNERLDIVYERLQTEITRRESILRGLQSTRKAALKEISDRRKLRTKHVEITKVIRERERRIQRLTLSKKRADQRIGHIRELVRQARKTRGNIIRRVFNDSLNTVWRNLFVRLAPDEPFVPAFALPEVQSGKIEVVLETLYRSAAKAGNPRAMLSSGNLNTAALTFFLALHLSVKPTLPCLVIDDPIQSMDEVHISHFAALLRSLSKQHGRQIILSVHEKPLFDYLSLELSPAFNNDRLIRVEIGRTISGETVLECELQTWNPDPAIAA